MTFLVVLVCVCTFAYGKLSTKLRFTTVSISVILCACISIISVDIFNIGIMIKAFFTWLNYKQLYSLILLYTF